MKITALKTYKQFEEANGKKLLDDLKVKAEKSTFDGEEPKELRISLQHAASLLTDKLDHNSALLLEWGTGLGKTLAALNCVKRIQGRWLVLHYQKTHRNSFEEEIKKWGLQDLNIEFETYAGLVRGKLKDQYFEGIIHDEGHHHTQNTINELGMVFSKYNIILSAEMPAQKTRMITKRYRNIHRWKISLSSAIKWNILPKVEVIGLEIPLAHDTRSRTKTYVWTLGASTEAVSVDYEWFMNNRPLWYKHKMNISCTEREYLWMMETELEIWKRRIMKPQWSWAKDTRLLPLGGKRKAYLSAIKKKYLHQIIPIVDESKVRTVLFADRINQLENTCDVHIHSKMSDKEVLHIVHQFNAGELAHIGAVGMLNESVNLFDIQLGIVLSLAGENLSNVQRLGRLTRGRNPYIIVLYVGNSKDSRNFDKYIKPMDPRIISPDEIYTILNEIKEAQ